MPHFASKGIKVVLVIVFAFMQASHAASDDLASVIRLSGIPGPFSFDRVSVLRSGEMWLVGGGGEIQHVHKSGKVRKMRIVNVDLNGVFFANANVGWAVGEQGTIVHTEDAGRSWRIQTSGLTSSLRALTCSSNNHCWAVGDDGIVLSTNDRGNRWTKKKINGAARLLAVSFVSNRAGWAVGDDGLVVRTTDGGQSWERYQAAIFLFPDGPFATPTDLLAVKFLDQERGWVAGAGGIARTVDGGKSWEAKKIEDNAFIGLVSNDGKTVWAISLEGTNYITKDGGLTWAPLSSEKLSAKRKPTNPK